jgi:antitoxin component YwqK of YwqJK toxin-antitoxin module
VSLAVAVPVDKGGTWEPGEQKPVSEDTYDEKGNRTEQVFYTVAGTVGGKIIFTYDEKRNEIAAIRYNANGVPESRTVSTYDAEGHKTESRSYTAAGRLTRRTVFTYDAQGNETAAQSYTPDGTLANSTVSTYDATGNLEEITWYCADGTLAGKVTYKRGAKGTLISSVSYDYAPDSTLQSRTDVSYDLRGNPTEVVWYGDNGRRKKTETSTYQHDVFGNWIRQTTTKWVTVGSTSSFEPPVVTYRTITYSGKGESGTVSSLSPEQQRTGTSSATR